MNETRLILGMAAREARERARSRAFLISTVILLAAAAAAVLLPALLADDDGYRVGVVETPAEPLAAALGAVADPGTDIDVDAFPDRRQGEQALADDLDVLVVGGSELVWHSEIDPQLDALVTSAVTRLGVAQRASALDLPPDTVTELLSPPELSSTFVQPREATGERFGPRVLIAMAGMVVLFAAINLYGAYILTSVIEEKQNRVVEVLLAHVRPRDLLAAKVIGHGVLGLAQISALVLVAAAGLLVTDAVAVPAGAYGALAGAVLWFVLGYAFYSVLYGALGSLASRTEDAQSAVGPLTIGLMAVYFVTFTSLGNPDGYVMVIGSFLPPTAPLMMPIRTALTDVATWEVMLAVAIEIVATVGLVRVGGRLYRGAVLRIGPKLSLREAWNGVERARRA